jgi:ParB-like chromosome segregation protein Spo0J
MGWLNSHFEKKGNFMEIRNRIGELRLVRAGDLVPNPRNWRVHPKLQREAMQGLLEELGYTDALIARQLPEGGLMLLDGHLRAKITPDTMVPVLIVDVTAEEADKILLTLDPIGAMASADTARLSELLDQVKFESGTVDAVLEGLREEYQLNSSAALDLDGAPEPNFEKADELLAKWGTEPGQLWQIGPHR